MIFPLKKLLNAPEWAWGGGNALIDRLMQTTRTTPSSVRKYFVEYIFSFNLSFRRILHDTPQPSASSFQAELAFSQSASGLVDGSEKVPKAAHIYLI